jgi:hypothetical protein
MCDVLDIHEVADIGLEVLRVVEVELFGRFLRVDEASDCVG